MRKPEIYDTMRVLRDDSSALIIDIQERLFPHMYEHETFAARTEILIRGLQVLGIPVHVTQQYSKGLGLTIPRISELFESFSYIEKTAFSCCDEPEFIKILESGGRKCMIIAGIESHVCIMQTVIDLLELNYIPVVIEDCTSSRKLSEKNTSIQRMRKEGAIVSSCESILFELCRFSGRDEFKAVSSLVK